MEEPKQKVEGKRVPYSKDESTATQAKGASPKELGMTEAPSQKVEGKCVPHSGGKDESKVKQEVNPTESGMTEKPSPKMNEENVAVVIGKDESTAKQDVAKGANPKELGLKEPNRTSDEENVRLSIGQDESTAKQAEEADPKELQLAKAATTQKIANASDKLQGLQSYDDKSINVQDLKKRLSSVIEDLVEFLSSLPDGPMTGAPDVVLQHIVSFLDHDERDVFVLVSHQMYSIVESYSKKALKALLEQLKESHYVDENWPTRVRKHTKRVGASTYRRQLVCAPQVNLYSVKAKKGDETFVFGKHLALPESNQILCSTPWKVPHSPPCNTTTSIEVMDLETRQLTRTFSHLPENGYFIPQLRLCGTHIVVPCDGMAMIFTRNGDLVHNVNLGSNFNSLSCIAPCGEMFHFLSVGQEGRAMISEINVESGQITRDVQLSFAYSDDHGLCKAGKWIIYLSRPTYYVLNPKNLSVVSDLESSHDAVTCSVDSEFIVGYDDIEGRVDILNINEYGQLSLRHSLPGRFCHRYDLTRMLIHGTTLYLVYGKSHSSQYGLLPIDTIDMTSGRNLGPLSYPHYDGLFCFLDLFTNGKEVFVSYQKRDKDLWSTIMAFPMLNGN